MPAKTKTKKKQATSKTITGNQRNKAAKKKAVKAKVRAQKKSGTKGTGKPLRKRSETLEPEAFSLTRSPESRRGLQSGDLQGLSRTEGADSESVAELAEEGNQFEADVVLGVERADVDEDEVRTREVPADDVPDEYLDKD